QAARSTAARPPRSRSRWAVAVASLAGIAVLGAGGWRLAHMSLTIIPDLKVAAPEPKDGAGPAPAEIPLTDVALSPERERALNAKETFSECTDCPQMIVVPHGSFAMGSAADEPGQLDDERPQHTVTFLRQFAVGKFPVTFSEWDACL